MFGSRVELQTETSNPYLNITADNTIEVLLKLKPSNQVAPIKTRLSTCLVLDRSGSMEGDKLNCIKEAAKGILELHDPDDQISIITFGEDVKTILTCMNASNIDKITRTIDKMKARGLTPLYEALDEAGQLMSTMTKDNPKIILFTDGNPTDEKQVDKYGSLSTEIFSRGITISTIGVGGDYNDEILRVISDRGGGWWEHLQNPENVNNAFINEINRAKSIITRHPYLWIHVDPRCKLESCHMARPIARELHLSTGDAGAYWTYLPDMCLGENQEFVFRMRLPQQTSVGENKIALFTYGDSMEQTIAQIPSSVEFTEDTEIVKHYEPRPMALFQYATIVEKGTRAIELGDKTLAIEAEQATRTLLNNPLLKNALEKEEEGRTKLVFNATKSIGEGKDVDSKENIYKIRTG